MGKEARKIPIWQKKISTSRRKDLLKEKIELVGKEKKVFD